MSLTIVPVTLAEAKSFVAVHHRHNKPPTGHKFSIGVRDETQLRGVVVVSRPIARAFDDNATAEVSRTCTDGTPNANSMLYGAAWRAAKAMGYRRAITYTQADETGASLRASGWVRAAERPARRNWAESSVKLRELRDPCEPRDVVRVLWRIGEPLKIEGNAA